MIVRSLKAGDAKKAESLRKDTILKNIHTFTEKFEKEKEDEAVFIDQDECVECGVCLRAAGCPEDAIYLPEESKQYPRSIRREFSDPGVQYPTLKQGGRGTEEMKTNDVTGRYRRGEYGMALEFGRPGTGISIVTGGLIDDIVEISKEIGLKPHTAFLSLGIHGKKHC